MTKFAFTSSLEAAAPAAAEKSKSERINLRTNKHIKQRLMQAADLRGIDLTSFTIWAASELANQVISEHERTFLKPADHARFFEAIDNPASVNDRLASALRRHQEAVSAK